MFLFCLFSSSVAEPQPGTSSSSTSGVRVEGPISSRLRKLPGRYLSTPHLHPTKPTSGASATAK